MTTRTTTTEQVLIELAQQGIEVQTLGEMIRYRPKSAITPNLLARLQASKAELLTFLDTDNAMIEPRHFVAALWTDHVWLRSWGKRFHEAKYANLDSLRRVLTDILEQAEAHHRRRDWPAFVSTCRYLRQIASGELWDDAKQTDSRFHSGLTSWDIYSG